MNNCFVNACISSMYTWTLMHELILLLVQYQLNFLSYMCVCAPIFISCMNVCLYAYHAWMHILMHEQLLFIALDVLISSMYTWTLMEMNWFYLCCSESQLNFLSYPLSLLFFLVSNSPLPPKFESVCQDASSLCGLPNLGPTSLCPKLRSTCCRGLSGRGEVKSQAWARTSLL